MSEAPVDIVLTILKGIQKDLADIKTNTADLPAIRKDIADIKVNTAMIPTIAKDLQELSLRVGEALELGQQQASEGLEVKRRLRRIEEHLGLEPGP